MARRVRKNPPDWMGELDPNKKYTCSHVPITAMGDRSFQLDDRKKPVGLWYGCGAEWIEYMEDELPSMLADVRYLYEVIPNMDRIISLRTVEQVRKFDRDFGTNRYPGFERDGFEEVRWKEVARHADGIEICPYQWTLRTAIDWYYAWDVASGCIWRPDGLRELRLVARI
jgi:hypothetical protein